MQSPKIQPPKTTPGVSRFQRYSIFFLHVTDSRVSRRAARTALRRSTRSPRVLNRKKQEKTPVEGLGKAGQGKKTGWRVGKKKEEKGKQRGAARTRRRNRARERRQVSALTPRRLHPRRAGVPPPFPPGRHSPPPPPTLFAPLDTARFSFPPLARSRRPPGRTLSLSLARPVVPVPAGIDSRWRAVTAPIVAVCR